MLKHPRRKKNNNILWIVVIALVFIGGLIFTVQNNDKDENAVVDVAAVDSLAQCITEKGMKMYGASWCPHCKNQKAMFGTSFAKVDYIECTTDQVKCNIAGVQGYPTRTYQGQKYEGEQTLQQLAKITGCTYNGAATTISNGSISNNP